MPASFLSSMCGCALIFMLPIHTARSDTVAVGVNVVNPQQLALGDLEALLDQLQKAGIGMIRVPLAPAWGGGDYRPAIEFIQRAHERGIKADLIVGLQYREGARRRPAVKGMPNMWPSFPLSSADPEKFRTVFEPLFNELEDLGITLAALELGNEINWAAFNGEFPIPGRGRVLGSKDLARDGEGLQMAEGYRTYLRTLSVLKDIRDRSRLNRQTPILSAGLADPGFAGPRSGARADAVTIAATIQYLRENGLDALIDAYSVHTYPWADTAAKRRDQLEKDTLADCRSTAQGKPCWLTEWGLATDGPGCGGSDARRASRMNEILGDLVPFVRDGRLKGLLYFSWDDGKYGIFQCGALTQSGRLAIGFDGSQ